MALVLADRVQDLTSTTGTGTVTLANAPPAGFQSFGTAIGNGNTTYYVITGGSQWEVGIGTYTAAGTSLSRDTVLSSSNSGNLVNFSAGDKTVFVTYPAEKSVNKDAANNVNISITGNAATATQATNIAAGAAGSVPYQTAANTTAFLASASGVLVGGNPPTFSTTPTLTGTNFTAIPNAALSNSSVTIGTTAVALGATSTTLAGLTSVTLTQDPTLALQAATKQYVDTVASTGIHFHAPVRVESPVNLTATYNNGTAGVGATLTNAGAQAALVIDGVTLSVADRVLIYQQSTQTQNGIYVVTSVGSGSTNWILTRASDANTFVSASPDGLSEGSTVFVQQGTTGAGGTYTCNTPGTITFGTTAITFAQISSAQIYSAGTGLTLTGTVFSLTTPVATTLGGTGLTTFGATNRALFSSGTNTLTAGTLPVAAGGTGQTTYTDGQLLIGKTSDGSLAKATITAGTSISVTNGDGSITITNTAPDQTVSLTGSGTTTITGSYPNFNIASADQFVGTVTSVSASVDTTGTDIAVAVTNSTTTPAIALSIPTSSASARGALTSTDWSTFNAKQTALISGTNIKTINGTSVLGSGDIVTPAGGTQQFTSSGSITAGQPVSLNSDGTVSTTTGISQTATFNTTGTSFSPTTSGANRSFGSFYDSSTGWHFAGIVAGGSGGSAIYLQSYKISSTGAITDVNIAFVNSINDSPQYTRGVVFKDTTSNRIMIAICGNAYVSNILTAFTVNTSTGAMSNAGSITAGSTGSAGAALDAYFDSFSNRIVVVSTNDSGGGSVRAFSFTFGVGFTQTASDSFGTAGGSTNAMAAAFNSNTNTGRVFYREGAGGQATRTISINAAGNTITLGAQVSITGTTFGGFAHVEYFPSIDRFVVQWSGSSQLITQLINPSTGIQVTATTSVPNFGIYYAYENFGFSNSYDTVNNVLYSAGADALGGTGLYTWFYTITASNITYTNGSSTAGSGYSRATSYTYDSTLARGGISLRNLSTDVPLTIGFLPALFSTNADKFIGFSTQSVSTGAAVTVTTLGGVNTNQSALTTGLAYYLQVTGALSTTPSAYGIVARALSTTSVQVTTGGAFKKLISQTVISGSPSSVALTLPSGYTQFEITFQDIRGGTTSFPALTGFNSSSSAVGVLGRGQAFLPSSSVSSYTQSANLLALTGGQQHSASQIFGGSLLLQSSASANIWSYTLMTSFNNSGDAYFSSTGYFSGVSVTATLSGFGTLTNGVVTLYGIG